VGAALALTLGCQGQGAAYDCACTFLTDFDDAATHEVRVCAASAERAPAVARGCAQSGAPAPIEACTCKAAQSSVRCAVGECAVN
jgi:hypothetical protein